MINECLKVGGIMEQSNMVKDIAYIDYTSTSIGSLYQTATDNPDALINIMRDNVVVMGCIPDQSEDKE